MESSLPSFNHIFLARIRASHPEFLEDEKLLETLLLALVAKQRNIIVYTTEDDISRVLKLIVNILHVLFGLSVVKLKLRPSDRFTSDDFLRLLFLQSTYSLRRPSRTSARKATSVNGGQGLPFNRSSMYPTTKVANINESYDHSQTDASETAIPPYKRTYAKGERANFMRAQTDPTPSSFSREIQEEALTSIFPHVLAVSGLEHGSEQVQAALQTILTDRCIALHDVLRPLPPEFFVVYVCPNGDGRERPNIAKGLIDRFAMSIEAVPPSDKKRSGGSLHSSFQSVKVSNYACSQTELAELQARAETASIRVNGRLDLYLADLFSAALHHPHLDGMYLTVRCRSDAMQILCAWDTIFHSTTLVNEDPNFSIPGAWFTNENLDIDDVRAVFNLTVRHRLRVLDGPRQEILSSLIFGAVNETFMGVEWTTGRRTISEILYEITENV